MTVTMELSKEQDCFPYFPVDIHFLWQMTFDFDIFRVLVRSCRKKRNIDFVAMQC